MTGGGFPRLVAFKSLENGKYLRPETQSGVTYGLLSFSGEDVMSPSCRFELEKAPNQPPYETDLVNVKCCYNNKYWSRDFQIQSDQIICGVDDPMKEYACTVFKLEIENSSADSKPKTVSIFQYYEPGKVVKLLKYQSEIIDLDLVVQLPKYVAFIGNNDRFLGTQNRFDMQYVLFTKFNVSDPLVSCEIVPSSDGSSVYVKSVQVGKFWRCREESGYIVADADNENQYGKLSRLKPVRVGKDVIALVNIGTGKFCEPFEYSPGEQYLRTNNTSITGKTKLKFVELVTTREIYNIRFDEHAARVYNIQKMTMVSRNIINNAPGPIKTEVTLETEKKRVCIWNSTVSTKNGVKTKITVNSSFKPAKTGYEVNVESEKEYEWEESKETIDELTDKISITIPENMMGRAIMAGTRVCVDIPFTYFQRDTLVNGDVKINDMRDGIYSCIDVFDIHTVVDVKAFSKDD